MKKYEKIFKDIESKIIHKIYPENKLLPSEQLLAESYEASRQTIRQALRLLEEKGLIQKQHGRGSVVISKNTYEFPLTGLTSYKELQKKDGFQAKTHVIIFELITIDDKLAELTDFKKGTKVWHILRQRIMNDKPSIIDLDYILYDVAPDLTREIAADSIYEFLEETKHLNIAYAHKKITVPLATKNDQALLRLSADEPYVASIKSHVFLADTSYFQYTDSRHRVDDFLFTEFTRRKKH